MDRSNWDDMKSLNIDKEDDKTLISDRGRWSPLSLFRQVHLGVGKSENNLPSQGYELLQSGKQ